MTDMNREAWLTAASEALRPLFRQNGHRLPKFRVSCSFPSSRGLANKRRCIGECWGESANKDGIREVFISPVLDNPTEVLETLVHELAHAVLPHKVGHRKPFAKLATSLGLEGKPTATFAGDTLKGKLGQISEELGPYPHSKLNTGGLTKQPTRLKKVFCPDCGYVIRVTDKWLETGAPVCSCGTTMVEDDGTEVTALKMIESHVEYATHCDRFTIRFKKTARVQSWLLIDWESNRMVPTDTRQDALDLVDAVQVGMTTIEKLSEEIDDQDADNEDELGFNDDDTDDIRFLGDDEDEHPDYPEDTLLPPQKWNPQAKRFIPTGEDAEEAYAATQAKREGWVK